MIEVLANMGGSKWNAELLSKQGFFKEILNDSFSSEADFYVQKYSVLLLAKMLNQRVLKSSPELEKKLLLLLTKWLTSNLSDEIEGALEVIKYYASYSDGFLALTMQRDFL